MAEVFDMKLVPKDKADLTRFKNFQTVKGAFFDQLNGKVCYLNANHPDSHIYQPYFMSGGTAKPLTWMGDTLHDRKTPLFTLQELNYEDNIIFYTHDDVEKSKERKASKKTVTVKPTP